MAIFSGRVSWLYRYFYIKDVIIMKKYLIRNWWRYTLGGISLICSTAIDVLLPFVTLSMVDDVIVGRNMDIFRRDILLFVAAGLGRAFFQFVKEFLCDMSGCRVASGLRKDMMKHIFTLHKGYFDKTNTGELMARVKDDAGAVWDLTGFVGMLLTEATVYFIGVVICMIRLNWKLSLVPLVFMPFLAYVCKKSLWMMQDNKRKNSKSRIQVVNPVGVEAHDDNGNGPKGRRSKLSPIENCDFNPFTDEVISFERNQEECNLVAKIHETVKEDFKMARFLELLSEVCAESDFYSDAKVGEKMGCTRANTSVRHKKLVQFLREKGLEDEFRMLMAA